MVKGSEQSSPVCHFDMGIILSCRQSSDPVGSWETLASALKNLKWGLVHKKSSYQK